MHAVLAVREADGYALRVPRRHLHLGAEFRDLACRGISCRDDAVEAFHLLHLIRIANRATARLAGDLVVEDVLDPQAGEHKRVAADDAHDAQLLDAVSRSMVARGDTRVGETGRHGNGAGRIDRKRNRRRVMPCHIAVFILRVRLVHRLDRLCLDAARPLRQFHHHVFRVCSVHACKGEEQSLQRLGGVGGITRHGVAVGIDGEAFPPAYRRTLHKPVELAALQFRKRHAGEHDLRRAVEIRVSVEEMRICRMDHRLLRHFDVVHPVVARQDPRWNAAGLDVAVIHLGAVVLHEPHAEFRGRLVICADELRVHAVAAVAVAELHDRAFHVCAIIVLSLAAYRRWVRRRAGGYDGVGEEKRQSKH